MGLLYLLFVLAQQKQNSPLELEKDAKFAMDARTVALTGYKGMMQGKLIIIPSIKYKIEVFLAKLLPAKIIASYVGKWQQSLKN